MADVQTGSLWPWMAKRFGYGEGLGVDESKALMADHFTAPMIQGRMSNWWSGVAKGRSGGRVAGSALWGVTKAGGRGILSTFLPISMVPEDKMAEMAARATPGFLGRTWAAMPGSVRGVGKFASRQFWKWLGPVIWGTRMHYETKGLSVLGKLDKGVRITGEEASYGMWGAIGMAAGAPIGGAIASAIGWAGAGAAAGSVVPGAGTVIGGIAGMAIGIIGGMIGSWAWNKVVDVAEMPIKAGMAAWSYLKDLGIRQKRLELGGVISEGNRTPMAATMRQRALMQMQRSGINARSMLGHEASFVHI